MKLRGDFGTFDITEKDRILSFTPEAARLYMETEGLMYQDIFNDQLGIYSVLNLGDYGKFRVTRLRATGNMLRARTPCNVWDPRGGMRLRSEEFNSYPISFEGQECPDAFFNDCFDFVQGKGNEVLDISATETGRALYDAAIEELFVELGNDFYNVATFGMHAVIQASEENEWWDKDAQTEDERKDYYKQQMGIGVKGHLTLADELKMEGLNNFSVEIKDSEIDWVNKEFIGNPLDLFERCDKASTIKFRQQLKRFRDAPIRRMVHPCIYDAYERYLMRNFDKIPETLQLIVSGPDATMNPMPGVLRYKNSWVISMDEWGMFDDMNGVFTPRVINTMPGNFAIGVDVEGLNQHDGMGMVIEQSRRVKDKGAIFMITNFRIGTAIGNPDYMTMASKLYAPEPLNE